MVKLISCYNHIIHKLKAYLWTEDTLFLSILESSLVYFSSVVLDQLFSCHLASCHRDCRTQIHWGLLTVPLPLSRGSRRRRSVGCVSNQWRVGIDQVRMNTFTSTRSAFFLFSLHTELPYFPRTMFLKYTMFCKTNTQKLIYNILLLLQLS